MRNGDAAKIAGLVKNGMNTKQICERFANEYTKEEVIAFIPKAAKPTKRAKSSSDE